MSPEIIISGLALLLILALGRIGMVFGTFYELTSTLLLFLAMMVTLRYWHPLTVFVASFMPDEPAYAALGAYWALFLVGCVPLIVTMNRVTENAVPRYPRLLDALCGGLLGLVSATILVCCVMTSLSLVLPKFWPAYNREILIVPLDRYPILAYQYIERDWLGISATDSNRTRFPNFVKEDVDDLKRGWR